jgi:hypothetical protein
MATVFSPTTKETTMPEAKTNESEFGTLMENGDGYYVNTYAQALRALRAAKEVFVQPRLGIVEMDIRVPKRSARELLDAAEGADATEDADATEIDSYGSYFPSTGCFYIG